MWFLGVTAAELVIRCTLNSRDEDYDELSLVIKNQGQPADDVLDHWKNRLLFIQAKQWPAVLGLG